MHKQALSYPPTPLTDGRFLVRPWLESDLECVRQASTDPGIPRGTTVPAEFSPEEGNAFIHRQWSRAAEAVGVSQAIVDAATDEAIGLVIVTGVGVSHAIVDAATDEAIGLVIVSLRPQPHVGGLGYWVVPGACGRGAATAGVRLVTAWSFAGLALQRVEAWVDPLNEASQRVLQAAGFQLEGRLRNFLTVDGSPCDALVFGAVPAS